jgi:hypothetical protein
MFTIYLLALVGVGAVILAVMLDAVLSVSRKARWTVQAPRLFVVEASDRRDSELPFVGSDRRDARSPHPTGQAAELLEAA